MSKVKAILYIVGGVTLLVGGFILRGLLQRRGSSGVDDNLRRAGDDNQRASDKNQRTGDLNRDIGSDNKRASDLIKRGREILSRGKKSGTG